MWEHREHQEVLDLLELQGPLETMDLTEQVVPRVRQDLLEPLVSEDLLVLQVSLVRLGP